MMMMVMMMMTMMMRMMMMMMNDGGQMQIQTYVWSPALTLQTCMFTGRRWAWAGDFQIQIRGLKISAPDSNPERKSGENFDFHFSLDSERK